MEAAAAMHQKSKGTFQHSSFLAGGATSAAGRLVIANGILKAVWPHSGHYRPTEANFREFMKYLRKRNVDLTDVKGTPSYAQFMYGDADSKFAPSVKGVAATAHTACYYVTF